MKVRFAKGSGWTRFEIAGSRYGIVVGPRTAILPASQRLAKIGGPAPKKILVFPYPKWELVDDEPGKHLVTDDESQTLILEAFVHHGVDVVIDYEHASTTGEKAIAAGWIKELRAGGEDGLIGDVEWTDDAAAEIRKGQYRYHSPVAIYDKETLRVVALHSVALTNTPRTNNMAPITEQIAASMLAKFEKKKAKGGSGMDWKEYLIYILNLPRTATNAEVKEHGQRMLDSLGADDDRAEASDKPEDSTIAAAIGFVPESEVTARIEAALESKDTAAASADVLKLLGLEAGADQASVVARVVSLKHHEGFVSAAEHAKVVEKLAELDEGAKSARVEELLKANAKKLTPAMREEFREIAATNYALAVKTLAKMPDLQVAPASKGTEPRTPEVQTTEATIETPEGERRVDPDRAAIVTRNREIMADKGVSYAEANDLRLKEAKLAAKK